MNWRKLLNHFGMARSVAKASDPLIERADKAIDSVDSIRIVVVKRDLKREARLRALDLQAEINSGVRRKR